MRNIPLRMTDPQKFATVSLIIIAAVVIATSYTESSFYRQAIITHESMLFSDMVKAVASRDEAERAVSSWDLQNYRESSAQEHLAHTFGLLRLLPGFARIKIFRQDQTIVWSDSPNLIGTKLTHHGEELVRALGGEVRVVFNAERGAEIAEKLPQKSLLELYVPFTLPGSRESGKAITGALSIYRSPAEINETIQRGLYLLWFVTGLGGLILYVTLYRLFYAVYHSRQKLEFQLNALSNEQGRLLQIEKLSALGQMVGEIAHQINNPLVGVVNLAQLAERELDNPSRVKEFLGEIRKAGDHCRGIVQRMLRINKIPLPELQSTNMNDLAEETVALFQSGGGEAGQIRLEKAPTPILLNVDPILIRNALYNLIHNAIQVASAQPVIVSLAPDEKNGKVGCRIAVSDFGPGITAEMADKLFSPFFTTRPGGTGLGLAIAQHIVALHRGRISAENKPDGGAIFTIWLPAETQSDDGQNSAR